ncbi:Scr1 family TA system antitoxin-like transcriptional regulator [Streptomyces sp. NPDC001262]|uniref:helix-turn-helix domain-containing protein n=1 Tax=unclassified Streptomyces TaxID=2593676 RepID=UPI0036C29FE9
MQTRKNNRQISSTHIIGALLKQVRMNAQLTQRMLAERACVHEETIASIEQGRRVLMPKLAEQLDRILDTGGVLAVAARKALVQDNFPVLVQAFMEYEREAIAHSSYENAVVPGLLQTEAYARAVFRTAIPALSLDEIERRVEVRMERQLLLHREEPMTASFIVWEPVLLSRIGGQDVMREQVRHIRACADLPGVSVQVLELVCESHAGLSGPFVLLETPDHQHLAYTGAQRSSRLIADPDEVSTLAQKYGMLRAQALNTKETRALLDRLLGET